MMIKDVEYAFFAQLSYLNWNNLAMNELKNEDPYKNRDLIPSINVLSSDVNNYIQYTPFTLKPDENDEVGVYVIGQLSNVTLAGIKGGVESQLIKIKERKKKEETRGLKLSNQSNEKYSQNFSSKGGFKFNGRGEYCE